MFEGVIGCEDIVAKLEDNRRMVQRLRRLDLDPRTQSPFNFVSRGPCVVINLDLNTKYEIAAIGEITEQYLPDWEEFRGSRCAVIREDGMIDLTGLLDIV
jgi:hypothetical protein